MGMKDYGGDRFHRFEVTYCTIQADHIFATPEPTHSEIIEVAEWARLVKHVEGQKDLYGHKFKYSPDHKYGYWFTSHAGGVKIRPHRSPKITRL